MNTKEIITEIGKCHIPEDSWTDEAFNKGLNKAIEVINKHLEGMAIVPVEPSEEMIESGHTAICRFFMSHNEKGDSMPDCLFGDDPDIEDHIYKAMLEAYKGEG